MKERKHPGVEKRMDKTAGQDEVGIMRKEEFLRELEACLSDISQEERDEALAYYADYLEDAGEEEVSGLGTPQQVAEGIRVGLEQNADVGEFTEEGYRDERLEEEAQTPDRYTVLMKKDSWKSSEKTFEDQHTENQEKKENGTTWEDDRFKSFGKQAHQTWEEAKKEGFGNRAKKAWDDAKKSEWGAQAENIWEEVKSRASQSGKGSEKKAQTTTVRKNGSHGILFVILLIFFGIPAASAILGTGFSFVAAVFGGLFGIFGGLIGLAAAAFAAAIGAVSAGIAMIGSGMVSFATPAVAFTMIGGGFLLLAVGMLCFLLMKWGFGTVVPWAFRTAGSVVRCAAVWIRDMIWQMSGKGGAGE